MKAVIAGAGELGRLLAEKLSEHAYDVVLIDSSAERLEHLSEQLDIQLIEGSCVDFSVLKQAADGADILLAVCGDDAANVLCCQLASRLGISRTVCRLGNPDFFSREDGITPESFGIWRCICSPEEDAAKIITVLSDSDLLEEIHFSHPDAVMRIVRIPPSSLLNGTRVKDIPNDSGILNSIRFAAIVREKQLLVPHGETIFTPGDKVYIAGTTEGINRFQEWVSQEENPSGKQPVLIAGSSETVRLLAQKLLTKGYDIRIIEKDQKLGEKIMDKLPEGTAVINGDPTDEEVLEEAGIQHCEAFISAADDDEDNILSCIIAKRLGAKKTISVTRKPEYIKIVPTMDMVDCGFSSTLLSVNAILRQMETGTMRVDAYLQMVHAQLTEFRISEKSPLCNKALSACHLPPSAIFALLFREKQVLSPSGNTVFLPGDVVVAVITPSSERELLPFFPAG